MMIHPLKSYEGMALLEFDCTGTMHSRDSSSQMPKARKTTLCCYLRLNANELQESQTKDVS
jgi:hypothetical protein